MGLTDAGYVNSVPSKNDGIHLYRFTLQRAIRIETILKWRLLMTRSRRETGKGQEENTILFTFKKGERIEATNDRYF